MSTPVKEKITSDLKQIQEAGKQRRDRIRDIVAAAASQLKSEFKEGSTELRTLVKDAFSAAIAAFQETSHDVKDEVTASVEGMLDGISRKRQEKIAQTEAEIKRLQALLVEHEEALEQDLANGLAGIEEAGAEAPSRIREQIEAALTSVQASEEVALLKDRYAQLQAQAAILRANLAARTGTYYDRARVHLEEAKQWYNQVQPKAENIKGQTDETVSQIQQKLNEAAVALAKGETQVRQLLSDLLSHASKSINESSGATSRQETLPVSKGTDEPPKV